MVKIIYISHDGTSHSVDVKPGTTVMEGAVKNEVPGIDAECGGACACATCHVYIDTAWFDRLTTPSSLERSMLEFAQDVRPNSRLSCQIEVTDAIDGLVATTPARQH